jgi:hypothetical protein
MQETVIGTSFTKALLGGIALAFIASAAGAIAVDVEPDRFPVGTDLRTAFPGVVLSVVGEPDTEIRSLTGFSTFLGRNVATTGTRVFGQFPGPGPIAPPFELDNSITWSALHGNLRADFSALADRVRIDLIFDDDDVGFLNAYDSSGNLLESVIASGDGRGPVPFVTAEISRPDFDIAYIIAGGFASEGGPLDDLQVRMVPEPASAVILAGAILAARAARRARKQGSGCNSRPPRRALTLTGRGVIAGPARLSA